MLSGNNSISNLHMGTAELPNIENLETHSDKMSEASEMRDTVRPSSTIFSIFTNPMYVIEDDTGGNRNTNSLIPRI